MSDDKYVALDAAIVDFIGRGKTINPFYAIELRVIAQSVTSWKNRNYPGETVMRRVQSLRKAGLISYEGKPRIWRLRSAASLGSLDEGNQP